MSIVIISDQAKSVIIGLLLCVSYPRSRRCMVILYNHLFRENARETSLYLIRHFMPYPSICISSCAPVNYQGRAATNAGS